MNKDTILEILNSESETLLVGDVRNILDEELNKPEDEMDLDLIELCMDAIESAQAKKSNGKRVKMNISKVLIAAVIFVLLVALTIPVCAKYFNINVPNGIVEFYGDHFDVDISGNKHVDDILAELEKNGVKDAVLPEIVLYPETKIYDFKPISNDNTTLSFKFKNNKSNGAIAIQEYQFNNIIYEKSKLESNTSMIDTISIDETYILLYINNKYVCIDYYNNNLKYSIYLENCSYETAYQIAQTI